MGGGTTPVNVGLLLAKRATWVGTTLRTRPLEEKVARHQHASPPRCSRCSAPVRCGPVIDSVHPFDADRRRAPPHGGQQANTGKILVRIR
jgi:hypothetical protein